MSGEIEKIKQEIIQRLDILAFYRRHLNDQALVEKADGWSERVFCPIHHDQTTANFFINLRDGHFKCHACGAGGSVFDFWILMEGLAVEDKRNFAQALVALANDAGVDIKAFEMQTRGKRDGKRTSAPLDKNAEPETFIPKVNKADAKDSQTPPLKEEMADDFRKHLTSDTYKWLNQKRGLVLKTIEDWKIGWNPDAGGKTPPPDSKYFSGRVAIPVRCAKGLIRNFRYHSDRCEAKYKMINETGRGGPPRLMGLDRLIKENWSHVIICEGEFDCILLNQELRNFGLTSWGAVTGTHGGKTFEPEWLQYLFGKSVYLCLDCDETGKNDAASHASKFFLNPMRHSKFVEVKIIDLAEGGLDGTKESKDITDYFVKYNFTVESFIKLVNESPPLLVGGVCSDEATVEAEQVDSFILAIKDRAYIDKRITVPLTISGQSSRIYHAVRSYKVVNCPMLSGGRGKGECCALDSGECFIPYGNELFIQSCMAQKHIILKELAKVACQNEQDCTVEVIKKVVMEEYFAHQLVERWRAEEGSDGRLHNSQELVQASVYVLQPPQNIDIGPQNYIATGWIRTDPRTQGVAFFIENLTPMEDDWKKFTVERPEYLSAIKEIKENWTVDEILQSITEHVTNIYEADDILYAVLLTYLSPLIINFNNKMMRGWLNVAIIGDSGTGKSKTYEEISDWLELGDLFSALSGTRTGLLYAIKRKAGEWQVSIGRYVQASGKIIAIDETQETTPEEIKRMAIAMDKGWLEVSQVASGGYDTRVRTMFLMNAKSKGKAATISDFTYGCEALRECFDPMFIRRIDFAVFTTNQHNYSFYNKIENGKPHTAKKMDSRLLKALVYWAWTRNIDNIKWTDAATNQCLEEATKISEIYGHADDVPLVCPQDFRNNLARLSTAYAILDRNFTEDFQSVIIEPRHVVAMSSLVDSIYSSPTCNLRQLSKQSKRRNTLTDYDKIRDAFKKIVDHAANSSSPYQRSRNHFCQMLLLLQQVEYIRKRDLQDQLGVSMTWVQKRIAILQSFNMLEIEQSGYKTTRKFNLFMQKWQKEEGVEEMLDAVHNLLGDTNAILSTASDELDSVQQSSYDTPDPFSDD